MTTETIIVFGQYIVMPICAVTYLLGFYYLMTKK